MSIEATHPDTIVFIKRRCECKGLCGCMFLVVATIGAGAGATAEDEEEYTLGLLTFPCMSFLGKSDTHPM